jgi:hypothetical protein
MVLATIARRRHDVATAGGNRLGAVPANRYQVAVDWLVDAVFRVRCCGPDPTVPGKSRGFMIDIGFEPATVVRRLRKSYQGMVADDDASFLIMLPDGDEASHV